MDDHSFTSFRGRFQPLMVVCLALLTVKAPAGALFVIVEPAPMVAPACTVTGATSSVLDPMNTSSSIVVWCLLAPS
jgi:hypothetical protein